MFQQFLSNGFLAIIPVLIWNGVFSSKLPAAFRSDSFERDVSHFILIGESICRYAVFLMPLVLRLKIFTPKGKVGAVVFLLGILLYGSNAMRVAPNKFCYPLVSYFATKEESLSLSSLKLLVSQGQELIANLEK